MKLPSPPVAPADVSLWPVMAARETGKIPEQEQDVSAERENGDG